MEINKSKATLEVGKTVTLKVNNLATTSRVKWTSSNKKIATVSTKGKVTAKGAGTAKITAAVTTKAGKTSKYTSAITVKEATIYFTKQDRIVIEDGKLRYTLTFDTENGYRLNTQKFDKSTGYYGYDGQKQYSYSQSDDIKMGDITFNAKKATLIMDNADIDFLRVEFSRELNIILKGENKITGTGLYYTYTTVS